jgi:hypothetical protein
MFKRKVAEVPKVEAPVPTPTPVEVKEEEMLKEAEQESEEITEEKIVASLVQHEQRLQALESALLRIRGAI